MEKAPEEAAEEAAGGSRMQHDTAEAAGNRTVEQNTDRGGGSRKRRWRQRSCEKNVNETHVLELDFEIQHFFA